MKMTHALPLVCLLAMAAICGVSAQPHQPDLQKPFRDYGFEGSQEITEVGRGNLILCQMAADSLLGRAFFEFGNVFPDSGTFSELKSSISLLEASHGNYKLSI